MTDKMQWPMPALPHNEGSRFWELWYSGHLIMLPTTYIDDGEVELTEEVWDELPSEVQEGFFKLSLLEPSTKLEGVGYKSGRTWLRLNRGDEETHDHDLFVKLQKKYRANLLRDK